MKISHMYEIKRPVVSFEIFPPKADTPIEKIYDSIGKFKMLNPDYMSVTYGAGGTSRDRTIEIASKLKNQYNMQAMAHLTCIGQSRESLDNILGSLGQNGIDNIMALRGDPPADISGYDFCKDYFHHASDLIKYIKNKGDFCIGAAAYIEGHYESPRISNDLENLKIKVSAGADFLITQLFFDNRRFFDFLERLQSINVNIPVIPGIMPVFKADQIKSIAAKSRCSIPAELVLLMDKFGQNDDDMLKAGIEYAAEQISELIDNDVPGIHIYTMNRPLSTKKLLEASGLGH